jgi:hypothetical protein
LGLICCAFVQGRQLSDLRAQQASLDAQLESGFQPLARPAPEANPDKAVSSSVSPELLRLRDQVSRLAKTRDQLAPLDVENKMLKANLAGSTTNAALSGYIHKSRARMMGCDNPANTLETFLWAVQNKDFARFLEVLTPETIKAFKQAEERQGYSAQALFQGLEELPGFGILRTQQVAPDVIAAEVQLVPDLAPEQMIFKQIEGKWKLSAEHGWLAH